MVVDFRAAVRRNFVATITFAVIISSMPAGRKYPQMRLENKKPSEKPPPFVPGPLPADLDAGEAFEIYTRVVAHIAAILEPCDGRCRVVELSSMRLARDLKLKQGHLRAAVAHNTGERTSLLRTRMTVARFCRLVVEGDTCPKAIEKLGMSKMVFQFYDMFKKEMHRHTGEYITPGQFRKMVLETQVPLPVQLAQYFHPFHKKDVKLD